MVPWWCYLLGEHEEVPPNHSPRKLQSFARKNASYWLALTYSPLFISFFLPLELSGKVASSVGNRLIELGQQTINYCYSAALLLNYSWKERGSKCALCHHLDWSLDLWLCFLTNTHTPCGWLIFCIFISMHDAWFTCLSLPSLSSPELLIDRTRKSYLTETTFALLTCKFWCRVSVGLYSLCFFVSLLDCKESRRVVI